MCVRFIRSAEAWPIRQEVLYPGRPLQECAYPQDDQEGGFHLGVVEEEKVIGIGSFFPERHEDLRGWKHYRLRGMGVLGSHRGRGAGEQILEFALEHMKANSGDLLWCNARENAFGFYERLGFRKHGELFDMTGVGTHSVMYLRL